MNKVNYKHHGNIGKLSKHDTLNGSSTHLKTIKNWKLLRNNLCYEFHGKDELSLNQLDDWNSRPMSWEHCSNYTRSR